MINIIFIVFCSTIVVRVNAQSRLIKKPFWLAPITPYNQEDLGEFATFLTPTAFGDPILINSLDNCLEVLPQDKDNFQPENSRCSWNARWLGNDEGAYTLETSLGVGKNGFEFDIEDNILHPSIGEIETEDKLDTLTLKDTSKKQNSGEALHWTFYRVWSKDFDDITPNVLFTDYDEDDINELTHRGAFQVSGGDYTFANPMELPVDVFPDRYLSATERVQNKPLQLDRYSEGGTITVFPLRDEEPEHGDFVVLRNKNHLEACEKSIEGAVSYIINILNNDILKNTEGVPLKCQDIVLRVVMNWDSVTEDPILPNERTLLSSLNDYSFKDANFNRAAINAPLFEDITAENSPKNPPMIQQHTQAQSANSLNTRPSSDTVTPTFSRRLSNPRFEVRGRENWASLFGSLNRPNENQNQRGDQDLVRLSRQDLESLRFPDLEVEPQSMEAHDDDLDWLLQPLYSGRGEGTNTMDREQSLRDVQKDANSPRRRRRRNRNRIIQEGEDEEDLQENHRNPRQNNRNQLNKDDDQEERKE